MQIIIKKVEVRRTELRRSGRGHEKGVVYFFQQGENVLENLQNRRNRPYDAYRSVLDEVLTQAKTQDPTFPQNVTEDKLVWRQDAGCTCGCSPGFVRPGSMLTHDVFVDFEVKP